MSVHSASPRSSVELVPLKGTTSESQDPISQVAQKNLDKLNAFITSEGPLLERKIEENSQNIRNIWLKVLAISVGAIALSVIIGLAIGGMAPVFVPIPFAMFASYHMSKAIDEVVDTSCDVNRSNRIDFLTPKDKLQIIKEISSKQENLNAFIQQYTRDTKGAELVIDEATKNDWYAIFRLLCKHKPVEGHC